MAGVDDLLPEELVLPGPGGEEAPVHLDVPDVGVAGGDEGGEDVAVEEGRPVVLSGVGGVKGAEGDDQEGGAVLPSIHQVGEGLVGVFVTPQTLSKPKPGWQADNKWPHPARTDAVCFYCDLPFACKIRKISFV